MNVFRSCFGLMFRPDEKRKRRRRRREKKKEDGREDNKKNCKKRSIGGEWRTVVNDFRPREKGSDTREIGILIAQVIVDEIIVELARTSAR